MVIDMVIDDAGVRRIDTCHATKESSLTDTHRLTPIQHLQRIRASAEECVANDHASRAWT